MTARRPAHVHEFEAAAATEHDHGDDELVSRTVQSTAGRAHRRRACTAPPWAACSPSLSRFCYGRIGDFSPRVHCVVAGAVAAFVALYYVPSLKYPAIPPAVGEPDAIALSYGPLSADAVDLARGGGFRCRCCQRLDQRYGALNATLIGDRRCSSASSCIGADRAAGHQ